MAFSELLSYFRPDDEGLSARDRSQIQVNRLLSVLGAVSVPAFGFVPAYTRAGVFDPMWVRLVLGGSLFALFVFSFVSVHLRTSYLKWKRAILYVMLGWFAVLAALNGYSADHAVGYVFVFTVFAAVIGYQTHSVTSVLAFCAYGCGVLGGGLFFEPAPATSPLILTATLTTVTMTEAIVVNGWASLQEKLRQKEERLRTITENVSDGIFRARPDYGVVYANRSFAEIFGFGSAEAVCSVDPSTPCIDAEDQARFEERMQEDGRLETIEVELERRDGSTFTGLLSATVVQDEDGAVQYYDGAITDISERKAYEEALLEERDRFETLFEMLPTPVVRCRMDGHRTIVEDVNPAFESVFGIPVGDAVGEDIDELIVPDDEHNRSDDIERQALQRGRLQVQVERQTTDGLCSFQLQVAAREDKEGRGELYAIYTDASELKRREEKLEHEATHDDLTGLPNRAAARDELESLVGAKNDGLSALLYLDLDGFKQVNDEFGHGMGDDLLVMVGKRLKQAVRTSDLVARVGGDEFVVCVSDVGSPEVVYDIAERIDGALRTPVDVGEVVVSTPASIGIVLDLSRYKSVEAAVRDADAAMYEAKAEGETRCVSRGEERSHQEGAPA